MPTKEIPLHDIKPILEIQEHSFYYLIAIVVVCTLIILGVLYLLYKFYKNKKRFNIRAEHFKSIKSVDLSDAKKAAYELTFYGATFKDDSERHQRAYDNLLEHLQAYKYKKSVATLSDETKHFLDIYLGMIDV